MRLRFTGLHRLDWYIIRKFLVTFFMAILFLAVIIIIFDVSEKIEDFINKEAPLKAIIFDYYSSLFPAILSPFK